MGLTQLDLAKYLEIPKSTITFIESRKKPINMVFYWALSGVLTALANATDNTIVQWIFAVANFLPNEKLRQDGMDICQDVVDRVEELGIAKAQTELNEKFYNWAIENKPELMKYFSVEEDKK